MLNSKERFFAIETRDSTLRVPQSIFPESRVINEILSYEEKNKDDAELNYNYRLYSRNGTGFYINRSSADLMHVINFLSGQSFDKTKKDIIQEILTNDFEIYTNVE